MHRKAKIDTLDPLYHVIIRRIERRKIFQSDEIAVKLKIGQPAVSRLLKRGEK